LPPAVSSPLDPPLCKQIVQSLSGTPMTVDRIAQAVGCSRNGTKFKAALDTLVSEQRIAVTETPRKGASPIRRYSCAASDSLSCQADNTG
jgi:hypothetical protein